MPMFNSYYQPMYTYPQQVQQQPVSNNSSIIWVQGEAGAKSYLVAPNNTVQLWDSERQTIYLKSADASGMPSMKILDYTVRDNMHVNAPITPVVASDAKDKDSIAYATKDDVRALNERIASIRADIDNLTSKKGAESNE